MLAPTLFGLYLAAVLETMSTDLAGGVYIKTRVNGGGIFNLARLKSSKYTREHCIRELLYADDSALVSNNLDEIQTIVDKFSTAARLFGLRTNVSKTELLFQPSHQRNSHETNEENIHPAVYVNGTPLKKAESFTYLGSTVTNTNSSDLEVERRIQAATKSFGALHRRLWSRHDIKLKTKIKVYNAAVVPSLLYATETMTLYQRHVKKLTRIQLRHLRQLLGISLEEFLMLKYLKEQKQ